MPCVYSPVDFKLWHIFAKVNNSILERVVLVHVFGERGCSGIFITNDDIVYGVGSNIRCIDPFKAFSYKQEMFGFLGIGETIHTNSPVEISELSGCGIICFSSGIDHTIALSKTGNLWVWGRNNFHQLGNYHKGTINRPFLKMKGQVKAIATGDNYSLVLLNNNTVMHWGTLHSEKEAIVEPTLLAFPDHAVIQEISCGCRHAAALTATGEVYLWGQNMDGQLGHGFVKGFYDVPVLLVNDPKVLSIGCGSICTFVLYENGEMGSCGCVGDLCKFKSPVNEFVITNREQILCVRTQSEYYYFNVISDSKTFGIRPLTVKGRNWQNVFGGRCTPQFLRQGVKELQPAPPVMEKRDIGNRLFDCKDYSDLTVRLKDGDVHVHKLIMKTFCKHFNALLSGPDGESIELLDIQVYNPKPYKAFLKYIYTGSVEPLDILDLTELYGIALSYSENELKNIVLYLYQLQLNVENISVAYTLAQKSDYDQLIEICKGFASSYLDRANVANGLEELTIELSQILLTVDSVSSTYALAYNSNYTKLKELCCKFASSNWDKVVLSSSFEELSPEMSRSLMRDAAQYKNREQYTYIGSSFEY